MLALLCCAPAASADWSGDGKGDVLAVDGNGGAASCTAATAPGASCRPTRRSARGWGSFTALLATDWSGDGRPDLLARKSDGGLLMYRGNAHGGFATGTGETIGSGWGGFTALLAPGDFSGDGKKDILARQSDGSLLLYRGNGDSGFASGGVKIGSGWGGFTALLAPGDWNGDRKADVLARTSDGKLLLYRGNGAGGWVTGRAEQIGSGWQRLHGADVRRRLQRRRQRRHPRPQVRRLAPALPGQRRRRVHLALPEGRIRLAVALVPHARGPAPPPPPTAAGHARCRSATAA